MTFSADPEEGDIGVEMELSFQSGSCTETFAFVGIVEFNNDGSETWTGLGTYATEGVKVAFAMKDARFVDNCDYPISGAFAVTDGDTEVVLNYTNICGRAQLSVDGGSPQQVDLGGLPELPPCGQ